jgi:GST-like protein
MIDLYYWTTPNGHKITIFLEETQLAHTIFPVDINKGDQFEASFLSISPNNRIPAIVDHKPYVQDLALHEPLALFESGAILEYLADKTGKFLSGEGAKRYEVLQWLYWQVGGLGPMAGQNHHFSKYAPERIPYATERYINETNRLYGVLNKQLSNKEYMAGEYSIADMATYPWIVPHRNQGQDLDDFPDLKRWFELMSSRPAVIRAYEIAKEVNPAPSVSEQGKKILFGQRANK